MREGDGEGSVSLVNAGIAELEQERNLLRQEVQDMSAASDALRMELQVQNRCWKPECDWLGLSGFPESCLGWD